ncbi:MAG: hypothetical protein K1X88_17775 [Nannocystaceae bacterium]|nr:hypothetical protein [Nannocystaceae bacterium]
MNPHPQANPAVHTIHHAFKLPLVGESAIALDEFIPIFHGWIRNRALADEVMIDVADYAHVHGGPGVLLVCHEGHYVVDRSRNLLGLAYHRRRGQPLADGTADATLALRRLIRAARLLADDPALAGRAVFDTTRLELRVLDRLRAPNDDAGWAAVQPSLRGAIAAVWGHEGALERHVGDPRAPLSAWARLPATALAALHA